MPPVQPLLAHQGTPDETIGVVLVFAGLWIGWVGWDRLRGSGFTRLPHWAGVTFLAVGGACIVGAIVVPAMIRPPGPRTGPRPSSTARLSIEEPATGEAISGDTFPLSLRLTGATIIEQTTIDLRPDTGHIHVSLDGELLSMAYGDTTQMIDASGLEPGPHTLQVEFVAADHAPFDPPVVASVTFERSEST